MTVRGAAIAICFCAGLHAQVVAVAKGPDQINLTWPAMPNAGYGYLVEIQSAADSRYASWTELAPIRPAGGFVCDMNVVYRGSRCNNNDAEGAYVYNPPVNGVPYWVTEPQYLDPQDGSPAQFIAWGLKPGTAYRFRVRTYSRNSPPAYGSYSPEVTATTLTYAARYVSPAGKDANDGTAPDAGHAWRTLSHAAGSLACGQELVVMAGNYENESITMDQHCGPSNKAVVWVNAGEAATIVSEPRNSPFALHINGDHIVVDGLAAAAGESPPGAYDVEVNGAHNALLNIELRPRVTPSLQWGLQVRGAENLVYRSYLHDYGSPNPVQNPNGDGGFILAVFGGVRNVIWSNHLTRGGHDSSLCKAGCSGNRWLNNVMDGGWGHGWINIQSSRHNLVEGNVIQSVAQMVPFYKPGLQVSDSYNTLRRNLVVNSRSWSLEVSSLTGDPAANNLIYNNTFYSPGGCYFQSATRGVRSYYNDVFANNICYRLNGLATEIYLGNPTNRILANDILPVDNGKLQPDKPVIVWNRVVNGAEPKTVAAADKTYGPFARNKELDVAPEFVDESKLDLHLAAGSPLIGAGVGIVDAEWGSTVGPVDVGAYGIAAVADFSPPATDTGMEKAAAAARAGDLAAALEWLKSHPQMPGAGALAAAMARMAELDEDDRAGLPADPGKPLDTAGPYIYWGLDREALDRLQEAATPLALYRRGYCRERLGYAYYSAEDFAKAAGMPPADLGAATPDMALVLQMALARNPLDANAHFLLGAVLANAGQKESARSEFANAMKLRPSFPQAAAALAKLGPAPEPVNTAGVHPSGSKPPAVVAPVAGNAPADIAAKALSAAAAGDLGGAQKYFTVQNFPQKKAEDTVREAYIELRLQRLLALAAAKNCAAVDQSLTTIGDDDRGLPFTFDGFGVFIRRVRFQYLLGFAETACGDKAGRKQYEKVSKATPEIGSTDYAYPLLALARLGAAGAPEKAAAALEAVRKALAGGQDAARGVLLYNQGLLQLILGKKEEAAASFRAGADASPNGFVRYLNLDVLRTIDNPQF